MMCEYIVDNDNAYNELTSLIEDGAAKVLSLESNIVKVQLYNKKFNIELLPQYTNKLNNIDNIINGKDLTKNIVNISIKDNLVYMFTEIPKGVSYITIPYKHWVLSPVKKDGFSQLKGNQYFRYIKEFPNLEEYLRVKNNVYRSGMYTLSNYSEAYMIKNGVTYFKGMKIPDVSLLSFDIETTGLDATRDDAKVLLITNTYRKYGIVHMRTFNVEDYESQYDMINDWCLWVIEVDPSLIIGHNIIIFDIPYIKTIMDKIGQPLILGRLDEPITIDEKTKELRVDGTQTYTYRRINIFGRELVDTFFLAIKADIKKKYESYGLKKIIQQEGMEKTGRQHYDASKIRENWANLEERKKIIQYAEEDSEDPIKLFDLMIAPFFYLTPYVPKPFQMMIESASGSQLNSLMVRSYLQEGFSVAKADDIPNFEGAISMGIPGIYDNLFKVDVASLYPSLMLLYKISPKEKDYNNNLLKALEYFTNFRLKAKQQAKDTGDRYYEDLEQAVKVFINSVYGLLGANGLNYNYGEGAADVTAKGRAVVTKATEWATGHTLKKVIKHIKNKGKENEEIEYEWILSEKVCEGKGYTLANCDTDSISFTAGRSLDKEERQAILNNINSIFPSHIKFADDGFFKRAIVLRAKNYILQTPDGKLKFKGSSLKDKKREPALREMMTKMIDSMVYDKNNLLEIYHSYIKECLNVIDINRWVAKKTISKAILKCADDPTIRANEMSIYDAIKDIPVQEGDKVYLYTALVSSHIETKEFKNGNVKEKIIKDTCLRRSELWNADHDVDKLLERVHKTIEILDGVLDMDKFIDYSKPKNKTLLTGVA